MTGKRTLGVILTLCFTISVLCVGCSAQQNQGKPATLDPDNPIQIELWTYYNGTQKQAFDNLIAEFNETKGKELGIVVAGSSLGGVGELAAAVTESAQGLVGSAPMPDAFLAYPDTAFVIDGLGKVADVRGYLSEDEKDAFIDSFLAEGDLDGNGSIKIFPVSKATETLQINLTDWRVFATETGSMLDELKTVEGITLVAQRYYEWTDSKTPEADDGRPFFGRDSMANYLITGSQQLGQGILNAQNGICTFELDEDTMRALWDNYYVPLVNGYFSAEGRFRSDAVKTGGLICYVGSSSSVVYFPTEVTVDDAASYPIEFGALTNPVFEQGRPCAAQQGAGFVVASSDEKRETACVEFLKWFTETKRGTEFSISAGYIPVTKEACTEENITAVAAEMPDASKNYLIDLHATLETIEGGVYANVPFEGSVDVRNVLERSLAHKAVGDRDHVLAMMASGVSREQAVAGFMTDENFQTWLGALAQELKAAVAQ